MAGENLIGIPETRLPAEPDVVEALRSASSTHVAAVVEAFPGSSLAWAQLSDVTEAEGRHLEAYAYARVGYHRGLDALRKGGWRGAGPVPWAHEPNRGVLRSFYALRRGASAIGETHEVERLTGLLNDSDPQAIVSIETALRDSPAPKKAT